ncbi:Hypothetical protein, putative, partial [Bodo saltans]
MIRLLLRNAALRGGVPIVPLSLLQARYISSSTTRHPLYDKTVPEAPLLPVEMVPVSPNERPYDSPPSDDDADQTASTEVKDSTSTATIVTADGYAEPLCGRVSPAKRFVYWAFRRLRDLPPEWGEYYRRMLRQEVKAARFVGQAWDGFMLVVDGYRKGKWVLSKYGIEADPALIPKPYNNFWEETTHEERVWAHRRSIQLKDLQALQRDEDSLIFGAMSVDHREFTLNSAGNLSGGKDQAGSPVHALDLEAPTEEEIEMSRAAEEASS